MTKPTILADLRVVADWQRPIFHDGYRPAARRDLLEALGWVECGICEGMGNLVRTQDVHQTCLGCIEGLAPSAEMVEAVAKSIAHYPQTRSSSAKAALLAAFKEDR